MNAAPEDISLPSPVLLHCHCVMTKILYASGMGKVVEKSMCEWEDLKQGPGSYALRKDGKSDVDKFFGCQTMGLWRIFFDNLNGYTIEPIYLMFIEPCGSITSPTDSYASGVNTSPNLPSQNSHPPKHQQKM